MEPEKAAAPPIPVRHVAKHNQGKAMDAGPISYAIINVNLWQKPKFFGLYLYAKSSSQFRVRVRPTAPLGVVLSHRPTVQLVYPQYTCLEAGESSSTEEFMLHT